jgi:hypothetical protein
MIVFSFLSNQVAFDISQALSANNLCYQHCYELTPLALRVEFLPDTLDPVEFLKLIFWQKRSNLTEHCVTMLHDSDLFGIIMYFSEFFIT